MGQRSQQTIARAAEVSGLGFLWGADIRLKFLPAEPDYGIRFLRTDLSEVLPIPALVEYAIPSRRRTAIASGEARVEMIEHVMAALAGLQIDNCLVELDAPEPPGCDGSSRFFAEAIAVAGIASQDQPRQVLRIDRRVQATDHEEAAEISAEAVVHEELEISYHLDYGPKSPIKPHQVSLRITPKSFLEDLAFSRTFVLQAEAEALKAQGYGSRLTTSDLLIFGKDGPIENELRCEDECARHKLLDCLGDLALIGCDVQGRIDALRSGHRLNAELVRRLKAAHSAQFLQTPQTNGGCRAA